MIVGGVLDESIQLYRQHWVHYALVSATALLPPGLLLVAVSAAGLTSSSTSLADFQSGRLADTTQLETQAAVILVTSLITVLFQLLWTAAFIATTDSFMRGVQPSLGTVYGRAIRRFPSMLGGSFITIGLVLALILLATPLFVITLFGILGSLVAGIGLLFWWLNPGSRKPWLKWLIILAAPLGLPLYYGVRWSMYLPGVVLERQGPIGSFMRSYQLTDRQWFRVATVLTIAGLIVAVLVSAPTALVDIALTIVGASQGQLGLSPAQTALSYAVSIVLQILFASIGPIVYAVLFVDLRNRREGTDILERLSQLETELTVARDG
jgi:hypothetical protein